MYPQPVTYPDYSDAININVLRAWLQVSEDEIDDDLLRELGLRVFSEIERRTNRVLTERSYTLTMDDFCDYWMPMHPFRAVTKVEYWGEDLAMHELETTKYAIRSRSEYDNTLIFDYNNLPTLGEKWDGGRVVVTLTLGYATEAIPKVILSAVEHLSRHYYDNKDNPKQEFPSLVDRMIKTFSIDAI